MTIPLLRLRGWECQRRRDENKTFPSKSLFFFSRILLPPKVTDQIPWSNHIISKSTNQTNNQASKNSKGREQEEGMDREAKRGPLRVGRADEDAVAPRGDELVDEEAEPRRVDAVVVRHQQHWRRRRRCGVVHASRAFRFPFRLQPRLPFVRLLVGCFQLATAPSWGLWDFIPNTRTHHIQI